MVRSIMAGRPVISLELTSWSTSKRPKELIGDGTGFCSLKLLLQRHTSFSEATHLNPSQTVSLTIDHEFKHILLWRPFSFKPPQNSKDYLLELEAGVSGWVWREVGREDLHDDSIHWRRGQKGGGKLQQVGSLLHREGCDCGTGFGGEGRELEIYM